jgi:putative endonuclease
LKALQKCKAFFISLFMFYINILYSETAKRYYIGHSEHPHERLLQHNSNDTDKYTGKYADWKLMAIFECGSSIVEVQQMENFIKKQKSKKLLLKLIDPTFIPADKLSILIRVPLT